MLLVSTTRIIPGRAVPSFLSGRYPAVKVRKKLYVTSEKWGISERRIQKLCEENRIDGTEKFGRAWMIPKDAEKPVDGRMKTRNKQEENHGI